MTLEGTIVHVAITNAKGTIKEHRNPILESRCKSKRSDDALCRAPAVPGILPSGKIVEGEKAAGVYEGAEPPVFTPKKKPSRRGLFLGVLC